MKFNIVLLCYENDNNINFNSMADAVQKDFLDTFKTTKFINYLEKNISNMGSACKNNVSHYLKLSITKIKPTKSQEFFGLLGNSINLEIDANISQVKKKVVSAQWCGKELNANEIKALFNEENLIQHIDRSVKQLRSGNPFKTITRNKNKYYFYFKSANLL
jgi:hypothetical protein